jgi:O-antigen/teichoic acid export membrane protein
LVAANLAGGVTLAAAANAYVPILPRWPGAVADLRPLLNFGRDLVVSRIAWYAYSNADFVVVGRLLGAGALGAYSLAWNIASAPAEKLGGMVISVAPAILSEARSQAGEVRRLFLGMVQGVSLVVFPLSVGLAVVAEPLVYTVLGAKWAAAVTPLRLLSLALMFRSLAAIDPVVLIARRETHIDRNLMLLFAIVTPLLFVAGAQWGMGGIAAVWLFAVPALSLPLQRRYIWRSIDVSWRDWTRAIWPAASSAAVMAVAAGAVGAARPFDNPVATMALQIAVGAVAYPAVLWIAHRSAASALRRVVDLRPTVAEPRVLRTDPV